MRWRCQGCPRTWDDYANEQDFAEEVWGSAETIPASGVEPYTPRYFHTQSDGGSAQATCGPVVPDPEPHAYAMNTDHECDTCGDGFAAGQHHGGDYFSRRVPDDALLASGVATSTSTPSRATPGRYRCRGCGRADFGVGPNPPAETSLVLGQSGLLVHWLLAEIRVNNPDATGFDRTAYCGPVVEDPDPDKLEPPTIEEAFGFVRAALDRCHGHEFADRVLDVLRPKIVEALEKPRG